MLTDFHILTVTYNDLDIDELGHFMIDHKDEEDLKSKLIDLKARFEIDELVYLSTCNRVSFICYNSFLWDDQTVLKFFQYINPDLDPSLIKNLGKFVKVYHGCTAIRHLFEVASSIDSMVIGEREIFRQFREAYNNSRRMGLTGDNMRLLEKYTVIGAKEVYANTKIGERPLSVVSLAIQKLLQSKVSKDSRILMIGAGETNRLVAKFLKKHEFTNAVVFNRNIDNAAEVQGLLNAEAFHLSDLDTYKGGFDIMIICTGATSAIVNARMYHSLRNGDNDQKLIIDLSVPRNVEADVISSDDNRYIDMEQLRRIAEENLNCRKEEVIKGKKILRKKLKEFELVYQQRQIERAMSAVPKEINRAKNRALKKVFNKEIETLDENSRSLILEMMDYMEKKCVSIPMKLARTQQGSN